MTPPISENYTQPAECKYASEHFPSIPGIKWTTLVPLYQEDHPDSDMSKILESCCNSNVWLYEDPEPCTAVCNSRSDGDAQAVQYCLNSREVNYGRGGNTNSNLGAKGIRVPARKMWAFILVGGLVLSVW